MTATGAVGFEMSKRETDRAWIAGSLVIGLLLGAGVVLHMKVALAFALLFLTVVVPLLVIGVQTQATVFLLLGILFLGPAIQIAPDLPFVMGDEVIVYVTLLLVMGERLVASDRRGLSPMPKAGMALLLFIPLTMLTIANGAARFGVNPVRGDYFEFVKFGKYVIALYLASTVRINRRFLRSLSWGIAIAGFIVAVTAALQSFNFPGVRAFFSLVYYASGIDNMSDYLGSRAAGTIGNPNELALFVIAGLVFSASLLQLTNRQSHRLTLAAFCLADALAIILSGSRMGFLGAALGVMLIVMRSKRRTAGLVAIGVIIAAFLVLVLLGIADVSNALPQGLHDTLYPLFNRAERFSPRHFIDILARFGMWQTAWTQAQSSLLLGYGPAKGAQFLLTSATVDSEIFIVTLRYGLVGLAVWIGIWVSFLRTARRASNVEDRESRVVGYALWAFLLVNLLVCTVNYTFLAVRRMTLLSVFVGLAAAIVRANAASGRVGARP